MATLLGIDATKTVVRTALLRSSYRKFKLEALGEADVLSHGSELEAIKAAIGALPPVGVRTAAPRLAADATSIALSGERSFYRRLELPATAQKELESVLGFELEATVPFEMSEAVYDYRLLARPKSSAVIPIFAALARIDDVRDRIALVRAALGHEPERVGTGALPLANLAAVIPELDRQLGRGPIAILDLGETNSDLIVMVDGEPTFARTLSRGTLGLPGSAPALARELRQTLAAWRTLGGGPLDAVYLVGGGASTQGAEMYLSTELGVSILPLPAPRLDGVTPEQAAEMPRFAKALGLALGLAGRARGFNMRRGPLEAERHYPFLQEKVPLLAGLGAVIVVSFGFSIVAEMRALGAEHEALTAELASVTQEVLGEETTDPDKARELLESGPGAEDDPMPKADAFDVMVQLSKAVPKDLVHDVLELDMARGHVVIQGTVPTSKDAEKIAEGMRQHRCFRDVKIPRTGPFGNDGAKQKYVLEFDVKCRAPDAKKTPGAADSAAPAAGSVKPEGGR